MAKWAILKGWLFVFITTALVFYLSRRALIKQSALRKIESQYNAALEKFRIIFDNAIDGILIADIETKKFIMGNPTISRMLGYSSDEISQIGVRDIHPETELLYVIEQFEKQAKKQSKLAENIPIKRKDGSIFYADIKSSLVHIDGKQCLIGIFRDVTEKKAAEDALRESEREIREAQTIASIGSYVYDIGADKWTSSAILDEIFGIDADFSRTVEGWGQIVHTSQRDEMLGYLKEIIAQHKRFDKEYRIIRIKDGVERWVLGLGEVEYSSSGIPLRMVGTIQDITERKNADELLKEREAELSAIYENAPVIMLLVDGQRRVVKANKFAAAFADSSLSDMLGLRGGEALRCLYSYDDPNGCGFGPNCGSCMVRNTVLNTLETGDSHHQVEATLPFQINGNNKEITFSLSTTRLNIKGEPMALVTLMDITEQKRLQEQLRQAQKMEAIGQLAGGVAHDFNNILNVIMGFGDLTLMEMEKDDPNRLNIKQMLEAAGRAAHLTKDLLLFSRKQIGDKRPVDLNETITKIQKFIKRVIGEDIQCKTILSTNPLPIFADTHQIEQVLMNLATNARDAMAKGGLFTITTEPVNIDEDFISTHGYGRHGQFALITISDTGIGMDEVTRQKIFEPFFTTKEVGKGTGLGLAVVYGIIKQHEGYVNVYSEPDKGTTFRIYLPVLKDETKQDIKTEEDEYPTGGTETILLAEDDIALRALSSNVLTHFGYNVIEAVDGQDAVNKFRENRDKIDLLLFDLIMPNMNGKEAYDEIMKIKSDVKGIFASGYAPDILRQKAMVQDNMTLLFKPVSPKDLLKTVRTVLDKKGDLEEALQ
jgi:PAS domain S-box-containing protein